MLMSKNVLKKWDVQGILDTEQIPNDCAMLMSKNVLKKWDVNFCFEKGCVEIRNFNLTIPFDDQYVPIVNIFDVTTEQIDEQWNSIPNMFKVDHCWSVRQF